MSVSSPLVEADGLEVKFGIEKTDLQIGEPLVLVTRIAGKSANPEPVQYHSRMQLPEGNDVEVFVQAPGEVEKRASGALESAIYSALILHVGPGESYQHTLPLLYEAANKEGYLFNRAGQYRLRAKLTFSSRYRGNDFTAEIPPTTINVTAPTGAAAEAYAQLANPAAAKALELTSTRNAELIARLRQVGEKYPQTVQGREALRTAVLSEAYSEKADLKQIIPRLKKYQSLYPEDRGTDHVVYTIAAAHNTLQQIDLAREWYFYLLDAYPASTLIRREDQLYVYYYGNPAEAAKRGPWYLMEKPWEIPGSKLPVAFQPVQES